MAVEEILGVKAKDTRTVGEYLADVTEVEKKGLHPEYSEIRNRIIAYWNKALGLGLVHLDDKILEALDKTRIRQNIIVHGAGRKFDPQADDPYTFLRGRREDYGLTYKILEGSADAIY